MRARASGEFWRREKKDSYVMYMYTHTHTFFCIDIDVYGCRRRCRSRHRCRYAHRDLPKLCKSFSAKLPPQNMAVPEFLKMSGRSRYDNQTKKPLLTHQGLCKWFKKLIFIDISHMPFDPGLSCFLPANSFSLKSCLGKKHHPRRDFSLKTRCSWRLFERDPGGSGLGMGEPRVTRWVCFHGGFTCEYTNTPL